MEATHAGERRTWRQHTQGSGAHGAYIAGVQHIRKAAHMESPHAGEQHIWRQHTQGSSTYGDDTRRGAAHMGTKHAGEQRIWRRRHTQGSSAYGEDDTRRGAAHMEKTTHAGELRIWRRHTQGSSTYGDNTRRGAANRKSGAMREKEGMYGQTCWGQARQVSHSASVLEKEASQGLPPNMCAHTCTITY